jgi:hypothetical protein
VKGDSMSLRKEGQQLVFSVEGSWIGSNEYNAIKRNGQSSP